MAYRLLPANQARIARRGIPANSNLLIVILAFFLSPGYNKK